MKVASTLAVLMTVFVPGLVLAAEDPVPPTHMREVLKARIAEDARKASSAPAPKEAAKPTPPAAEAVEKPTEPAPPPAPPAVENEKTPDAKKQAAKAPATVMPKMEVKRSRITVLDQKLAEQEKEIEREKKNLKASEVDLALNDMKVAKPLAIFGGDSAQFRQRVASERVQLMEAEKDLIEAIAHAKTKEEKQELQKQLDELKTMRRQLDQSLR